MRGRDCTSKPEGTKYDEIPKVPRVGFPKNWEGKPSCWFDGVVVRYISPSCPLLALASSRFLLYLTFAIAP